MRKIKRKIKPKNNKPQNIEGILTKRVKIAAVIVAVFLIIAGIIFYIELSDNKIVIKNNTDIKLDYVKAYYIGPDIQYNDGIHETDIAAGKSISIDQEPIYLLGAEANLEIRFKFENHEELFVDAGIFNDNFEGKVSISFTSADDGKIKLNVKAKSGVVNSSGINCDDTFTINLSENLIED